MYWPFDPSRVAGGAQRLRRHRDRAGAGGWPKDASAAPLGFQTFVLLANPDAAAADRDG